MPKTKSKSEATDSWLARYTPFKKSKQEKLEAAQSAFETAVQRAETLLQQMEAKKVNEPKLPGYRTELEEARKLAKKNTPEDCQQAKKNVETLLAKIEKESPKEEFKKAKQDASAQESFRDKYNNRYQECLTELEKVEAVLGSGSKAGEQVRKRLGDAAKLAEKRNFEEAYTDLGKLLTALKSKKTDTKKLRKLKTKDVKSRPKYERRKPKVDQLILQLRQLPGGNELANGFASRMSTVAGIAAKSGGELYATAYEELGKLKKEVKDKIDACKKAVDRLPKDVQKQYQELRKKIDGLGNQLPVDKVDSYRTELNTAVANATKAPKVDGKALADTLKKLSERIDKDPARGLHDEVQQKVKTVKEDLKKIEELLPADDPDRGALRDQYAEVLRLAQDRDFAGAKAKLEDLEKDLKKHIDELGPEKQKWAGLLSEVLAKEKVLKEIRSNSRAAHLATEAYEEYQRVREFADRCFYGMAADMWPAAKKVIEEAESAYATWQEVQTLRDKRDKEWGEQCVALWKDGLTKLKDAASTKDCPLTQDDLGDFSKRYHKLDDTYRKARGTAETKDEVNQAFDEAIRQLTKLGEEIGESLTKKDAQQFEKFRNDKKANLKTDTDKKKYQETHALTVQKLDQLEAAGADASQFRAELPNIEKKAKPDTYVQAEQELADLLKKAEEKLKEHTKTVGTLQTDVANARKEVRDQLKEWFSKVPKGLRVALRDKYDQAKALMKGGNTDALQLALDRLNEIKKDLETAKKNLSTYEKIDKELDRIKKDLKALGKDLPKTAKELKKKLTETETQCKAKLPEEAETTLKPYQEEVARAQSEATEVVKLRQEFDKKLNPVRQSLEALDKAVVDSSNYKKYEGELKTQFEQAETGRLQETAVELKAALEKLDAVKSEADKLLQEHQKAVSERKESPLVVGQRDRVNKKKDLEDEKEAWKVEYSDFRAKYRSALAAAAKVGYWGNLRREMRRIDTTGDQADGLAKRGDLAKARALLKRVTRDAERIAANPRAAQMNSRKQLPKLNGVWKNAVAAFNNSLDALLDRVKKSFEGDTTHNTQLTALEQAIPTLQKRFLPDEFEDVIKILSEKKGKAADMPKRRKAREDGLRRVRAVHATLIEDPLIDALAKNPYGLKLDRRAMFAALTNLNVNLLRCLR